jgi:hypothetical protein
VNKAKLPKWLTNQGSWDFLGQVSILQEVSSVGGSRNRAERLARSGLRRSGRVDDAPGRDSRDGCWSVVSGLRNPRTGHMRSYLLGIRFQLDRTSSCFGVSVAIPRDLRSRMDVIPVG